MGILKPQLLKRDQNIKERIYSLPNFNEVQQKEPKVWTGWGDPPVSNKCSGWPGPALLSRPVWRVFRGSLGWLCDCPPGTADASACGPPSAQHRSPELCSQIIPPENPLGYPQIEIVPRKHHILPRIRIPKGGAGKAECPSRLPTGILV